MPRLGVVGSLVWDEIHGRDPLSPPVEEWGGIAYALAGLDAALPEDWEIVPLIKVGRDLAGPAGEFLRSLRRLTPGGRCVEVPVIEGAATANSTVTATTGTWNQEGLEFSYQWFLDGEPLKKADGERLRVKQPWVGSELTVVVTATNADGETATATSEPVEVQPKPKKKG